VPTQSVPRGTPREGGDKHPGQRVQVGRRRSFTPEAAGVADVGLQCSGTVLLRRLFERLADASDASSAVCGPADDSHCRGGNRCSSTSPSPGHARTRPDAAGGPCMPHCCCPARDRVVRGATRASSSDGVPEGPVKFSGKMEARGQPLTRLNRIRRALQAQNSSPCRGRTQSAPAQTGVPFVRLAPSRAPEPCERRGLIARDALPFVFIRRVGLYIEFRRDV
jgi:hypothetical protein